MIGVDGPSSSSPSWKGLMCPKSGSKAPQVEISQEQHQWRTTSRWNVGPSCQGPFSLLRDPNSAFPNRGDISRDLFYFLKISDNFMEGNSSYGHSPEVSQMDICEQRESDGATCWSSFSLLRASNAAIPKRRYRSTSLLSLLQISDQTLH